MTKVKLTRAKWSGPTEHSSLCSAHFEQTCFERGIHSQFGMAYEGHAATRRNSNDIPAK